jgi:hypothetical protein
MSSRITIAELRAICDSLNDERGRGGQSKRARLVGWHYRTIWRKLSGESAITQRDKLAIRQAAGVLFETPCEDAEGLSSREDTKDASPN